VDSEDHYLMNLVRVVVCVTQAWITFLMLVSRLLPMPGVDASCERSFLVRFGSIPLVRIVGVGLRFGTVTCYSLMVFFFLCVVVVALPRNALVAMNLEMAGVACCDVVWR